MKYVEEIAKIENHLREHPHDYQSKVELMILRSKQVNYNHSQAMNLRKKRVAEIRRRREQNEKSE